MFDKSEDKHEDRKKRELIITDLKRRVFGNRYAESTLHSISLSNDETTRILKFLKEGKYFLVYCGNAGIGKTTLCAALFDWAFWNVGSFRYWHESELLKRVRSSMEETKGDYLQALKYLIDDDFLIIDDIGSSEPNQWRKDLLFDAIDERYNSMQPTVITSNFPIKTFWKVFHERFCSRLFAKENTIIELLENADFRKPTKG